MKDKKEMPYCPTPAEARWLRQWNETGRQLTGLASVKTQSDFRRMQLANIQSFTDWAAALTQILGGSELHQKQRRRKNTDTISEPEADKMAENRIGVDFSDMAENAQNEN